MSEREKEDFLTCLSSRQGMKLLNVKFYRGTADLISEAEFRAEICASAERRVNGELKAGQPPRVKGNKMEAADFLASL